MGLERLVALVATLSSFSMTCLTAATFQIDSPGDNPMPLAERVAQMELRDEAPER
jgi:hypothetical protein